MWNNPIHSKSQESAIRGIVFSANTSWYLFNFRQNTISAFLQEGYDVYIVAPRDDYSVKLMDLGCKYFELRLLASSKNIFSEARVVFDYIQLYRKIKPFVAFHFTIKCNLYGSIASRLFGVPYANNISGLGSAFNDTGLLNFLIKCAYRVTQSKASWIFVQNQADYEYLTKENLIDKKKAEVIPGSGVDLRRFQPHHRNSDGKFVFVFAGRILVEKGIKYLAEAMRQLRSVDRRAECWIFGFTDNCDMKYVSEVQLHLWESDGLLRYGGNLEDVREAFVLGDCVVLPSYYREGVPRSLLEAAAMAKPIVTTDWIGCREVVKHGVNGYLCKIQDSEDLADSMLRIMRLDSTKRREMGEAGRKLVEEHFNEEIVIGKYLNLITPPIGIDESLVKI